MQAATTGTAAPAIEESSLTAMPEHGSLRHHYVAFVIMMALAIAGPFGVYPVFLAKVLCFALFACAFNLLIGFVGLLSFGHAAFWGAAAYASAHAASTSLASARGPLTSTSSWGFFWHAGSSLGPRVSRRVALSM